MHVWGLQYFAGKQYHTYYQLDVGLNSIGMVCVYIYILNKN